MIQNRNLEVIRSSTFFGISKNVAFVSSFDDETIAEKLMKATLYLTDDCGCLLCAKNISELSR